MTRRNRTVLALAVGLVVLAGRADAQSILDSRSGSRTAPRSAVPYFVETSELMGGVIVPGEFRRILDRYLGE